MVKWFEPCAPFGAGDCLTENIPRALGDIVDESPFNSLEVSWLTRDLCVENTGTADILAGCQIGVVES